MVQKLIAWGLQNRLVVILAVIALASFGVYAFLHINVEAYPDPAPAIVEVIAQYPGASAEEVERQVTIPLEIALAGMPGLDYTRSKSLFGLAHLRNQFDYGTDYFGAAGSVEPPEHGGPPGGREARDCPHLAHRRDLSLRALQPERRPGPRLLHAGRHEGAQRLEAGERVSPRAADRRHRQLRRSGEALRDSTRSGPAQAIRHHARTARDGNRDQQRQRRRRLPAAG